MTHKAIRVAVVALLFALITVVAVDQASAHKSSYKGHKCDGTLYSTCYLGSHNHRVWRSGPSGCQCGKWVDEHHHYTIHVPPTFTGIHYRHHVKAPKH